MTERAPRRLSESSRVEAFSDGVFSIAITLLVLELAVPAIRGNFKLDLADEWVSYVAYLAAFGTIGVLWMGHHTVFTLIAGVDTGLLWRNLVLLLTVSVVPFPTAVIASAWRVGSEIPVALLAGFPSFLAPYVLPLVPGYLSAVSAVHAGRARPAGHRAARSWILQRPVRCSASQPSSSFSASAPLARRREPSSATSSLLEQISGFVLVVFGLAFMGLLPWPERLVGAGLVQGAPRSRGSRVLLGGAFAVCAAPCIGPVLAAILVLAGLVRARCCRGAATPRRLLARASAIPVRPWPARSSRGRWGRSAGCATTTDAIQFAGGLAHGRARPAALLRPPSTSSGSTSTASPRVARPGSALLTLLRAPEATLVTVCN